MEKIWYISNGNKIAGPFKEKVILSLHKIDILSEDVFLWKKGMKNWDFLGNIFSETDDNTTEKTSDEQESKNSQASQDKKGKTLKIAVLGIGVAGGIGIASTLFEEDDYYSDQSFVQDVGNSFVDNNFGSVFLDTSGDGILDTQVLDLNNDGFIDTMGLDFDQDGIMDALGQDINGDGLLDVVGADLSGDGFLDTFSYDLDGDGDFDMTEYDFDGDGITDYVDTSNFDGYDFDLDDD